MCCHCVYLSLHTFVTVPRLLLNGCWLVLKFRHCWFAWHGVMFHCITRSDFSPSLNIYIPLKWSSLLLDDVTHQNSRRYTAVWQDRYVKGQKECLPQQYLKGLLSTLTQQALGSGISQGCDYTGWDFTLFFSVPAEKGQDSMSVRPWPCLSNSSVPVPFNANSVVTSNIIHQPTKEW